MRSENVKIIGLTGGIGSGKTAVSSYFEHKGGAVVDADQAAREIVAPGSPALRELATVFGYEILDADGTLNRKKLAAIAFSDKALKSRMDEIMHEKILRIMRERIDRFVESGYTGTILVVIPLLFEIETGFEEEFDEIWVVDAEDETRIRRVMERDGISRREILNIMKSQLAGGERRGRAHVIIDNSGSMKELYEKLDEIFN